MFEGIRKLSIAIVLLGIGGYLLCTGEFPVGEKVLLWGIGVGIGGNILDHIIAMKNGKKKE